MQTVLYRIGVCFLILLAVHTTGWAMEANDLQRLKAAGISEATIALMLQKKSIETVALTVEEVLDLKNAGFSEETLRMLVQESAFSDAARPRVYGRTLRPISVASIDDLLALKAAGISDATLQALIIYHSDHSRADERERAWRLLHQMGFIIRLPEAPQTSEEHGP